MSACKDKSERREGMRRYHERSGTRPSCKVRQKFMNGEVKKGKWEKLMVRQAKPKFKM